MRPDVSILLSVFNGMPYLPLTVDSLLAQTHRDFELVINDNLSTDGSRDYLRGLAARDTRVRLVLNDENLGHSGGLNRGLAECRAPWIARMDADDIALPTRLERQLAFVRENPEVRLTGPLAYYITSDGRRVGKTAHDLKTRADFDRYMATGEMIGLLHPGVLMDAELVRRVGGYREPFGAANDIDLWARIAEQPGVVVLVQQEHLMEYRVHPGQISAGFLSARMKYEWARDCTKARRGGQPEPTWEAFSAQWNATPLPTKWNRWRKTYAKMFYRQAGLEFTVGDRGKAALHFAAAAALQPGYALRRLAGQIGRK